MEKINLNTFIQNIHFFINEAKQNKLFLYPTDTIYWLGWIWPNNIEKIYKIKLRPTNKKVSIILPAKNLSDFLNKISQISQENLDIARLNNLITDLRKQKKWFTLIIKAKKDFFQNLNNFSKKIYEDQTIGVRFLNHPFQKFVNKLNLPFITTSANISWEPPITHPKQLNQKIKKEIDYIIDDGDLINQPSVLIKNNQIIER